MGKVLFKNSFILQNWKFKSLSQIVYLVQVINKSYIYHEIHNQFWILFMTCCQGFQKKIVFCFYAAVTQYTSIYKYIWMTACVFWSMIGTGTVSIWYSISMLLCVWLCEYWKMYYHIFIPVYDKCNQFHIIVKIMSVYNYIIVWIHFPYCGFYCT